MVTTETQQERRRRLDSMVMVAESTEDDQIPDWLHGKPPRKPVNAMRGKRGLRGRLPRAGWRGGQGYRPTPY